MKIQSKNFSNEQFDCIACALGNYLGLLDDQRNSRPATMEEIEDFCFGPLRKIDLDFKLKVAIIAADIVVVPFDS